MSSPDDDPTTVVVVRRMLPVTRERVFAAWLDPALLARWMRPRANSTAIAEVDARVGGQFRIVMKHASEAVEHRGEYLAIEPPSRLSFTWISVNTDEQPTLVNVEFIETATGTELILTHRRLPRSKADAHKNGWTAILGQLELTLTSVAAARG
jgi:uncharacterized protein YndB with AHSA1/START domain